MPEITNGNYRYRFWYFLEEHYIASIHTIDSLQQYLYKFIHANSSMRNKLLLSRSEINKKRKLVARELCAWRKLTKPKSSVNSSELQPPVWRQHHVVKLQSVFVSWSSCVVFLKVYAFHFSSDQFTEPFNLVIWEGERN